jgi:hypothetical protein
MTPRDRALRALRELRDATSVNDRWTLLRLDALGAALDAITSRVREVMPETMGGTPDLFMPEGGWDAWEELAVATIGGNP